MQVIHPQVVHRDLRDLAKAAVQAGWTLFKTGGDHIKWRSPSGAIVFSASTPSDFRVARNVRTELRKRGLDI